MNLEPWSEALFRSRTVLIFGEVDAALAHETVTRLFALAATSKEPIRVVVSSPGGHVESGDAIHDAIRFIDAPVDMIGSGWVASAGALIYVAAPKERRVALPNTRFLLHQPLGGASGRASDIEIEAKQVIAIRERLDRIFARETGQTYEKLVRDTERNHWMNAQEAVAYGLVSRVIDSVVDL
jgi:ATP-dependent Clp protease protease subunit